MPTITRPARGVGLVRVAVFPLIRPNTAQLPNVVRLHSMKPSLGCFKVTMGRHNFASKVPLPVGYVGFV